MVIGSHVMFIMPLFTSSCKVAWIVYYENRHGYHDFCGGISFQVIMITPTSQKVRSSAKVPHAFYQVPYKQGFIEDTVLRLQLEGRHFQSFSLMPHLLLNICEAALNSTKVANELKGVDLMVYDSLSVCAVLLGERSDIPRVEIVVAPPSSPVSFMHMIPMPVSYVPQLFIGLTDKMTFFERVLNLGAYLSLLTIINLGIGRPFNQLKVKYNIKPERSFQTAIADAELCLITADFALEYPQPLLPGKNLCSKVLRGFCL